MARERMNLEGAASVKPPTRKDANTPTQQDVQDTRLRISLRLAPEVVQKLNDIKNNRKVKHQPQSRYSLDAIVTDMVLAWQEPKEG